MLKGTDRKADDQGSTPLSSDSTLDLRGPLFVPGDHQRLSLIDLDANLHHQGTAAGPELDPKTDPSLALGPAPGLRWSRNSGPDDRVGARAERIAFTAAD